MLDCKLAATERSEQVDLDLYEEVVTLPLESIVRLLLDDDDNISGCYTGCLVTLAMELNGLTALHALVDVYLEHLLLAGDFLSVTRLALVFVVDDLACTRALIAGLLHLLDHRAHLAQGDAHATTGASGTRLDGALLAALSVAFRADDVASECELGGFALVKIFECDVYTVHEIFRLPWTLRTGRATSTEEATSTAE